MSSYANFQPGDPNVINNLNPQNVPPHWSIRISGMLLFYALNPTSKVDIYFNGNLFLSINATKNTCNNCNYCNQFNSLEHFNRNDTTIVLGNLGTAQLEFRHTLTNLDQFRIRDVQIFVDKCHPSCKTCSNSQTCDTCPNQGTKITVSTDPNFNRCKCNTGRYFYNYICISPCPDGYWSDIATGYCIVDCQEVDVTKNQANCQTGQCLSNVKCGVCKVGFLNYQGTCRSSAYECPINTQFVNNKCQYVYINSGLKNGMLNYRAFHQVNFGTSDMDKIMPNIDTDFKTFTITGSYSGVLGYAKTRLFSDCQSGSQQQVRIFGGYNVLSGGILETIRKNLKPHWQYRILADIYILDDWKSNWKFVLRVDDTDKYTYTHGVSQGLPITVQNQHLCGNNNIKDTMIKLDLYGAHSSLTELKVRLEGMTPALTNNESINTVPNIASWGVRNFYIVLDECTKWCTACTSNGCSACEDTYFLLTYNGPQYTCVAVCPEGLYGDTITKKCEQCSYKCNSCSTSKTECITCADPTTRLANPPNCECKPQFYDDGANPVCPACQHPCLTCKIGPQNCLICRGNYMLKDGICICPVKYYEPNPVQDSCLPCDNQCLACETTSSNCLDCDGNRVRLVALGPCVCPDNTLNDGSATCMNCHYSCQGCTTFTYQCNGCYGLRTLSGSDCICLTGYYDPFAPDCVRCDYKCASCLDGASCLTCVPGTNRQNGMPQCPCASSFFDNGTNSAACQACAYHCVTCIDSVDNCTSCPLNRYRVNNVNGPCVCIDGLYDNQLNNPICQVCAKQCKTCENAQTQCKTCYDATRYAEPACICTNGYFEDSPVDFSCKLCGFKCKTCSVSTLNCLSCAENRIGANCDCPDGSYNINGQSKCVDCHDRCATCSAAPDLITPDYKCITFCFGNRIHVPGTASCDCPDGTFNLSVEICPSCSSKCKTCIDKADKCLTCGGNRINSTCDCPAFTYDTGALTCLTCNFRCKSCATSQDNCSGCAGNRQNSPTCSCPFGFFDTGKAECPPCSNKCASCSSGSPSECGTCKGNRENAPVCQCPSGFYDNTLSIECKTCFRNCLTCTGGSSIECVTCRPGYIFSNNSCLCKNGFYDQPETNECIQCDSTCKTCKGPSSNDCLSCSDVEGRELKGNECACAEGIIDSRCINRLEKVFVSNGCNYGCVNCDGQLQCQQCFNKLILEGGECKCPIGFYDNVNDLSNLYQCTFKCSSICKRCRTLGTNMCTECEDNYEIVNGKCVGTIVENDTYDTIMTLLMFMVIITMLIVIPLTYLGVSKKFPRKINREKDYADLEDEPNFYDEPNNSSMRGNKNGNSSARTNAPSSNRSNVNSKGPKQPSKLPSTKNVESRQNQSNYVKNSGNMDNNQPINNNSKVTNQPQQNVQNGDDLNNGNRVNKHKSFVLG